MADHDRTAPSALSAPAREEALPPSELQRARATLLAALARGPWRFGFCHTLRRLDALQPERPRLGATARPADDPVRLGQQPSLRFAPSELAAIEPGADGRRPRLLVYFLGLLGPNGPLPLHLTEYARERKRNAGDQTLARFLDLFNHRMLSLLYRAWGQAQPAVGFDRPAEDRFGTYVGSLTGTGMPACRDRDAMPDLAKRRYAGHLAAQTRHPDGLVAILKDWLGLPVRVEEFIGRWLVLPADCLLRLGSSPERAALGRTATLGGRVWDHQTKFRLCIGPLDRRQYEGLLPGGELLPRVTAAVRNYIGDELDWELSPVLKAAEVPPMRLGSGVRLGWTTWLTRDALGRDGDDLKLDPAR